MCGVERVNGIELPAASPMTGGSIGALVTPRVGAWSS
jgi:hypothetical protein